MVPLLPAAPCGRSRSWTVALALIGAATAACRTGGRPGPTVPSAPQPQFSRSYVGQLGFLRYRGDEKKWSLDRKAVARPAGTCDVAVEVKEAAFEKGAVRLRLEYLGQPRVEGKRSRCRRSVPEIALSITGFRSDEPTDAVASVVGQILLTPEAFLNAHRIRFDLPPVPEQPLVADASATGQPAEMRLAREVTYWSRKLLWVEPAYADPARRVRYEGEVEFAAIVGSDGRIRGPRVLTPLEDVHERQVQRAFPLWRFEPARRGSQPVAVRLSERTVFRIYRR